MKNLNYDHPLVKIGIVICILLVLVVVIAAADGITDNLILATLHNLGISVSSDASYEICGFVVYFLLIIGYNLYYRYKKYRDEIDSELVAEIKGLQSRLSSAELKIIIYKERYEPETESDQCDSNMQQNQPVAMSKNSTSSPVSAKKSTRADKVPFFLSWRPAILCITIFFALVFLFHIYTIFSHDTAKSNDSVDSMKSTSYSVDYETNYVGSVNSSFVHRATCRHAENILEKNRVYYATAEDAVADGRSKCSECLGASPTGMSSQSSGGNGLVPLTPPANGHILYEDGSDRVAPLSIKTSGSGYYLIRLRDHYSKDEVLTFFVHGGKEVECDVPLGEFDLSYSFGENWYGNYSKFGSDAYCAKADETFEFYEEDDEVVGWTVTLYAVIGGDLGFDEIPSDQF